MPYSYSTQQIKGSTRQVKLQIVFSTPSFTQGQLYYKIDTANPAGTYNTANSPTTYSFTAVNNYGNIFINPNQYLTFSLVGTGSPASTYVNVVNVSDNFKRIGRFLANVQTGSGSLDPVPALNFSDDSSNTGTAETSVQTVLGLSQAINIRVEYVESGSPNFNWTFYVLKNGDLIPLVDLDTISVSNDTTLRFVLDNPETTATTLVVTLYNESNNDSTLDTFNLTASNAGP
jgi:hypothetical protein